MACSEKFLLVVPFKIDFPGNTYFYMPRKLDYLFFKKNFWKICYQIIQWKPIRVLCNVKSLSAIYILQRTAV